MLHLSDDAAYKRITAGRVALKFPALFHAVADGRLHLAAVVTLAPVLDTKGVDRWIADATHKTRREIEFLIVQQHPKPDLPERLRRLSSPAPDAGQHESNGIARAMELAPGRAPMQSADRTDSTGGPLPITSTPPEPLPRGETPSPAKVMPLAPARFGLQLTIDQATHDKLRRAQELMGHTTRAGDIAKIIDRALDVLIARLESRKLAATTAPRDGRGASANSRAIPADVKRAVRAREGDRCAYVSDDGHRCESRTRLEFDHVIPVAMGGPSTVSNVRQLCRTHNQLEASRKFGVEFMRAKRAGRAKARELTLRFQ